MYVRPDQNGSICRGTVGSVDFEGMEKAIDDIMVSLAAKDGVIG
ncbi:uncharacterized protein J3R85_007661 [Psidium guajava]|nr:uncharacterized protein J3R85_007661 [Psidium guajava]